MYQTKLINFELLNLNGVYLDSTSTHYGTAVRRCAPHKQRKARTHYLKQLICGELRKWKWEKKKMKITLIHV